MIEIMRRKTVEQILADRQIKAKDDTYEISDDEVVNLLIGQDRVMSVAGVVSLTLTSDYLLAQSKKGRRTYLEYELVRAISFESKEVTDRQAGFV